MSVPPVHMGVNFRGMGSLYSIRQKWMKVLCESDHDGTHGVVTLQRTGHLSGMH